MHGSWIEKLTDVQLGNAVVCAEKRLKIILQQLISSVGDHCRIKYSRVNLANVLRKLEYWFFSDEAVVIKGLHLVGDEGEWQLPVTGIVVGDFNIHVDVENDNLDINFNSILNSTGCLNHTPYTMLSYGIETKQLTVFPPNLSDHFLITFKFTWLYSFWEEI